MEMLHQKQPDGREKENETEREMSHRTNELHEDETEDDATDKRKGDEVSNTDTNTDEVIREKDGNGVEKIRPYPDGMHSPMFIKLAVMMGTALVAVHSFRLSPNTGGGLHMNSPLGENAAPSFPQWQSQMPQVGWPLNSAGPQVVSHPTAFQTPEHSGHNFPQSHTGSDQLRETQRPTTSQPARDKSPSKAPSQADANPLSVNSFGFQELPVAEIQSPGKPARSPTLPTAAGGDHSMTPVPASSSLPVQSPSFTVRGVDGSYSVITPVTLYVPVNSFGGVSATPMANNVMASSSAANIQSWSGTTKNEVLPMIPFTSVNSGNQLPLFVPGFNGNVATPYSNSFTHGQFYNYPDQKLRQLTDDETEPVIFLWPWGRRELSISEQHVTNASDHDSGSADEKQTLVPPPPPPPLLLATTTTTTTTTTKPEHLSPPPFHSPIY
ncbi:uncharacterized protein LOC135211302 [Macrobrachium nipponense]|uniref:uncharacterized protein LOC135211302 n=1 Tax=Macrobrachium nipponense TaxID=159736 RepID=UPI0030C7E96B